MPITEQMKMIVFYCSCCQSFHQGHFKCSSDCKVTCTKYMDQLLRLYLKLKASCLKHKYKYKAHKLYVLELFEYLLKNCSINNFKYFQIST